MILFSFVPPAPPSGGGPGESLAGKRFLLFTFTHDLLTFPALWGEGETIFKK